MPVVRFAPRPSDGVPVRVDSAVGVAQVTLPTKAGTPTDADVPEGAANGNIIVDTTASKLWVRIAGSWVSVTLA